MDRGISFYGLAEQLWGKPVVGVGIAGIEGKEGSTLLDIERFFAAILAKNQLSNIVYGALPGEVILNDKNKMTAAEMAAAQMAAAQMAAALFAPSTPKKELCCPLCGGETFRFLEDNRVRCMLCSDSGSLTLKDCQLVFEIDKSGHELLGSETAGLKHRDWLCGKGTL